jgi:hypothetical protein
VNEALYYKPDGREFETWWGNWILPVFLILTTELSPGVYSACYRDSFTFLYVDDVRTSQKARLWVSMAGYGDSFSFLYVDGVPTSQKTCLWASMACYGDGFTFFPDVAECMISRRIVSWDIWMLWTFTGRHGVMRLYIYIYKNLTST